MEKENGTLNVIGNIFAFIFGTILALLVVICTTRNFAAKFFTEKEINKIIEKIDVEKLLKDENGNDIKPVANMKEEFVNQGIPKDAVDKVINSNAVREITSGVTKKVVDHVIYNKDVTEDTISEDDIRKLVKSNMGLIKKELEKRDIVESEKITPEVEEKIIKKIETKIPVIKEQINTATEKVIEVVDKVAEENPEVNEVKQEVDNTLNLVRKVFSKEVTYALYISIALLTVLIVLIRFKRFKFLKWFSYVLILSGIMLFGIYIIFPLLSKYISMSPDMFQELLKYIFNSSSNIFLIKSIICLVISIVLIIIYKLLNKKLNKA